MNSENSAVSRYYGDIQNPALKKLLLGSVGGPHLLDTACRSLDYDSGLAVELFAASWCASPFDGKTAATMASVQGLLPLLPPAMSESIKWVSDNFRAPENLSYFRRLAQKRDHAKMGSYIISNLEKDPDNCFWIQQGLVHAAFTGEYDFSSRILAPFKNKNLPLWQVTQGWYYYLEGRPDIAFELIEKGGSLFGLQNYAGLLATIYSEKGDMESAAEILKESVAVQPWRTSEILRLYDLKKGIAAADGRIPENLAVLLYSYNKADELDATLDSVAASDFGETKFIVLDNGSSDSTAQILDKWQDVLAGRMKRIDLPVNVGAAAARNWIMNDPDVKKSDYAVYLDDDVEVPENWLRKFGTAIENYPDAGAWGCRVLDFYSPRVMQSVDLHMVQPPESEGDGPEFDLSEISPNPFKVSSLHHQCLDAGYFDFMRPCASVTGCCHMFKTGKLLDNNGFSLFLSPSQYDDMEHDLRLCLKGEFPVYQGHLQILHRKKTGSASRLSAKQESNAIGNKYKMQAMHPRSEILKIISDEENLLKNDLNKKINFIFSS